ncbi:MAG: ATP-binding cassette domain-containing protein [Treponema sp.]|nr:ATP-binding cassette domain-containing protein [Treponema sp.]
MSYLSMKNINKIYPGNVQAVFDFNLDVHEGEFIVLVGPSGCGKSTVLRMIAGLEEISAGDMVLHEKRINDLAPSNRDVAMVFQDYALYGNMTVYRNIGFSLAIRGENDEVIHDKVMDVSKTVELHDYLNRYPKALSGGQRQRVAMGRSLAKEAKVLLMDEPLSNLDAKLRQQTRKELSMLHQRLRPTIVYVTHDQIEAMTLANRIVVMNGGYIQQVGTPSEIYNFPANIFTASFIGMPPINLVHGRTNENMFIASSQNGETAFSCALPDKLTALSGAYAQGDIIVGIRPENIRLLSPGESPGADEFRLNATVKTLELLGAEYYVGFDVGAHTLIGRIPSREKISLGQKREAFFSIHKAHFFDKKTGLRLGAK